MVTVVISSLSLVTLVLLAALKTLVGLDGAGEDNCRVEGVLIVEDSLIVERVLVFLEEALDRTGSVVFHRCVEKGLVMLAGSVTS